MGLRTSGVLEEIERGKKTRCAENKITSTSSRGYKGAHVLFGGGVRVSKRTSYRGKEKSNG